jgi:aryl-alcohol dehydrogenase-like predicted oxidoreductase
MTMMSTDLHVPSTWEEEPSLVYPRRPFGTRHGRNVTLPVLGFPSVALARLADPSDQSLANEAVRHAVLDLGIRYFDVAPEYGDGVAQERLGPALRPYRDGVFLAAKTMFRSAEESAQDLANTLKALKTDHLNLYQFHSISTEKDVNDILSEGGAMETFQKAKQDGVIEAIGFSAHSEPMAVRMIETGLVDTVMFPINFAAFHYGGIGKEVLKAATKHGVGVIALKAGARGRLTNITGNEIHVPDSFKHIPEWKRQEMINFPVRTSKTHPTCWYEPEDDPEELNRLILWSLNQPGVTAVLPPGDLDLLDGIANMLRGKREVPPFDEKDMQHMLDRYKDIVPIFHDKDESGTKVST